jgi:hypothetical protein
MFAGSTTSDVNNEQMQGQEDDGPREEKRENFRLGQSDARASAQVSLCVLAGEDASR